MGYDLDLFERVDGSLMLLIWRTGSVTMWGRSASGFLCCVTLMDDEYLEGVW